MQISELLGVLAASARVCRCTSNLEPYSTWVIIIMFIFNSTIQLTMFCTPWFRHCNFKTQSSRYLNPHDYLQAIRYRFYMMQHYSLAPDVQVQQLLRQVQYASYQSVWQPGWTRQHNQPNHADLCTLLESPRHNLEVEDVISIVESCCSSQWRSIKFFRRAGLREIGGSDSVESSWKILQEQKELSLGRCYQCHCPYNGSRCYEIQAWSLGWLWYILPCNQVPDTQQM